MSQPGPKRFSIKFGITSGFLLLTVPSVIGMMWFIYARNNTASRELADESIVLASKTTIEHSVHFLDMVGDSVDTLSSMGDHRPESLRDDGVLSVLLRTVRNEPQIYSLYIGFAEDGAFNEVVRLPAGIDRFGAEKTPIPAGAVYVLRQVKRPAADPATDHSVFLDEGGKTLLEVDATKVDYDPRTRPFYKDALAASNRRTVSELYASASTGKPVLTISRRFGDAGGKTVGAVGANIMLDNLCGFLGRIAPGKHGLAMIIDEKGQLLAHPEADKVARKEGGKIVVTKVAELDTPQVLAAMSDRDRRTFTASDGKEYIASFAPFPSSSGRRWELLIVVPTDDFVGEIQRSTRDALLLGIGMLVIGILGIRQMSQALTRPIHGLIAEAGRIKQFDLDGEIALKTRIREVAHLAEAMATMKTALRSFARFVPKTLVRELLSTGKGLSLGGESRTITVLFSDLANFSTLAEKISPQDLTLRVSDYLEDVSQEVIRQSGIIDKYIGDAVMAIWNAPLQDGQHIEHACDAALNAVDAFDRSNVRWSEKGWSPLAMRIGLHTDKAIVGVIGSTEHMSYTALGDGVNIASRLEGINKTYGTTICVSHTIFVAVKDRFLMRPLDHVAVKGRKEPMLIYELMGRLTGDAEHPKAVSADQRELARLTADAFDAWTAGDNDQAIAFYRTVLERFPGDLVATLCLMRCFEEQDHDRRHSIHSTLASTSP